MADSIWTDGAGTGDLNTAGNWNGGVPGAGDNAYFVAMQSASVTASLADLTALLLGDVVIGEGYSGAIGSTGSPLTLSAGQIIHRGSGHLYFENGSTSDTSDVIIDTPSGMATIGAATAKNERIAILRAAQATLTSTLTGLDDLFVANAPVTIQGSNTIVDADVATGAIVNCLAPITNLRMSGGSWTQNAAGSAIANMYIGTGATVTYNSTSTITLAVVYPGGTLNMQGDARPKTITTARVFPGGRILMDGIPVTITNGGSLKGADVSVL